MRFAWNRSLTARALVVLSYTLLATPTFATDRGPRSFTEEEQRRLAAGELVQRPKEERKGSLDLLGGASWQVIDATPDVVWQALLDTPHYPRMMPRVLEARLVGGDRKERTVFVRQGSGLLETAYYLKVNVHEDRRDITFAIDDNRPHDLKAAWGFYTVRPFGDGRTLLAYGVMADIGDGLVTGLVRGSVHDWMLKTPWMIKRFVEGSGRHLYR